MCCVTAKILISRPETSFPLRHSSCSRSRLVSRLSPSNPGIESRRNTFYGRLANHACLRGDTFTRLSRIFAIYDTIFSTCPNWYAWGEIVLGVRRYLLKKRLDVFVTRCKVLTLFLATPDTLLCQVLSELSKCVHRHVAGSNLLLSMIQPAHHIVTY